MSAVVGPNGAGKTTLLRIAAGLQRPDRGSVSGAEVLYYGGFDTLPLHGRVNQLRRALGLPAASEHGTRRLSRLSRGQLHRVGLDAALDLDRCTILLDEPWSSLDPDARETLNDALLRRVGEGRVVVCSTHDLDEVARIADDILFLRDGKTRWERRETQASGFSRESLLEVFRQGAAE